LTVESESVKSTVDELHSWAGQLASESRSPNWVAGWYVWPEAVLRVQHQLETMKAGIIGLVGLQGVGKSSALRALHNSTKSESILFKWRRHRELYRSLLDGSHEASEDFLREYWRRLRERPSAKLSSPVPRESDLRKRLLSIEEEMKLVEVDTKILDDPDFRIGQPELESAEGELSRDALRTLQETTWLEMLQNNKTVLIDTPDYSKTDRRLMAKDLQEIYWLWLNLAKSDNAPNIVLAIQKEMFTGHFFFDKMQKIELEPLQPEAMLEAYKRRFATTDPFTDQALLTLARMSRGIFRRFLRYITLTLDLWQTRSEPREPVDSATVKDAVTVDRLAEDMELELVELFPKQSDLRIQAVRLLMHLEESGPQKQSELAERLGMEDYAISRLLAKLELNRYISRTRSGTDKIVDTDKKEAAA